MPALIPITFNLYAPECFNAGNMRPCLMLLLCVFLLKRSFAQADSVRTGIVIIGTVHSGNNEFGHKELFNELETQRPDIILSEQSTPFNKVFGLRTASFLRLMKPDIEQMAIQKYTNRYRNCVVLPFDTTISERPKYKRDLQVKSRAVIEALLKANLAAEDSIGFANYIVKTNSYYELLLNKSLKGINEKNLINRSRELYALENDTVRQLVIKYCADASLQKWYLDDQIFWEQRNNYMVTQIRKIASEYRGKKIVVLAGLNHKYFLLDGLSRYKDSFLTLISFPEEP